MEERDKLECLKHISAIHRAQFDERRKYEWKIVFSSLTFYILAVLKVFINHMYLERYTSTILLVFFLLALFSIIYLFKIHFANDMNLTFAENAEKNMILLLNNDEMSNVKIFNYDKKWYSFLFSRDSLNFWMQAMIIIIFAVSSVFLLLWG